MRRYELTGEKFWQYEMTGTEVLLEWGKIGGSGKQRSHKKYATEDVAKKEIGKLVAKKEAEGFVEIGATAKAAPTPSPSPSPSPSPAPVAAAPVASIAPRIVWTDDQKVEPAKDLEGTEGAWLVTIREHYEDKNWEGVLRTDRIKRGLAHATPEGRAWAERILATYAVGKAPTDANVEGDAAALADWSPAAHFAALWVARHGLVYLAKVLVAALGILSREDGRKGEAYLVYERGKFEMPHRYGPSVSLAAHVRRKLPEASAADQTAIRAQLESIWTGGSLSHRILAASAANDPEWDRTVAEEFLAAKKEMAGYDMANTILAFLRDPVLVTKLAKRQPSAVPGAVLLRDMGLDAEAAVIAHHDNQPDSSYAADVLALIESVPAAKQMAQSLAKKRAADVAKAYFERRPDLAIAALEPIVKNDSKLAPYAKPVLDAIVRKHPELAGNLPKKPKAKVTTNVPKALATAPALKKAVTLPEWAANLPQVLMPDGTALPDQAVSNLLLVLHESTLEKPHASLAEVKRACDPKSLAEFAWALFESWLGASGSSKEGWAFTALGHLGGDEEARKLAPLVRAWPGESQHARAVTGLSVLGAIGTDVALMHLHGIAQKIKFKGLQEKARAKMDELAKARGLTADELADRLVPDLGLDDTGSLSLDFGSRTFTVGFDEELKPFVRDGSGTKIAELPKPNKSDDAAIAGESVERWKTLKKDAKAIASLQITRLELAMCAMRRWKGEDFKTLIVDHPLVVHLARRLVWGVFDQGKLGKTFRVAEDRTLVSADDEEVKLPKDATIGLVHRMEMDEKLLGAWGDHLGRYEMLQPFDQIGRELYTIDAKEKKSDTLERTKGLKVKTGKVLGLETRGWRKGPPQDAGWVWEMNKNVAGFELSLPLGGGLCMGWSEGTPSEQELGAVSIAKQVGGKATFDMLPPVVFSEIVRELMHLEA